MKGERRRRRRPDLGTSEVPVDRLVARAGTPNLLNLLYTEWLWANRTLTRPRTVTPRRSQVQIRYLDARRHAEPSRHVSPTQPGSLPATIHPQTSEFGLGSSVCSLHRIKAFRFD